MVVGYGVMPPSRLSAADTHSPSSPDEGDEESGGAIGGDPPPPFLDLPRLLATARHGDLSTLPPDQRHLLARMLLAGDVMPNLLMQRQALMRRRRLLLHHRRIQQQQLQQANRVGCNNDEFKQPELPPVARLHSVDEGVPAYERYAREITPPIQRRPRERTPPSRRTSPIQHCRGERNAPSAHGHRVHSIHQHLDSRESTASASSSSSSSSSPSSASSSVCKTAPFRRCPSERTSANRAVAERSFRPSKRLRPNSYSNELQWVPVNPRTYPKTLRGLPFPSRSSSSSSSSSSESQWRPVKVHHLCDSFKEPIEKSRSSFKEPIVKSLSLSSYPSPSSATSAGSSSQCFKGGDDGRLPRVTLCDPKSSNENQPLILPAEAKDKTTLNDDGSDYSTIQNHPNYISPLRVPENSCVTPTTCSLQGASSLKYHWMNQLTRIFLQEVPEEKEAETAEGGASTTSSSSASPAYPSAGGSTACSSTDSSANLSNNKSTSSSSSTLSSTQGASVATTLAGSGMGNPFARAAPQATWGQSSEAHDHKPILAPSRLGPHSDAGIPKVSSSGGSSVLRQSALASGRPSGSVKSPSSFFTPPTLTVTGSSPPQSSRSAFKLKPSVLGTANPFVKGSSNSENRADSASGPEGATSGTSEETSPRNLDVSSSTSVTTSHTTAPSGDRDHSQSADSRTSSSNSISNSSNSRNVFVPLSRNGEGNDSSLNPNIRNSFIFGQNLESKVTQGAESSVTSSSDASATTNGERQQGNLFSEAASGISRSPDSAVATNGRIGTGNLFSEAASEILPAVEENAWNSGPSLAETSRELTEKENSQKRKFDQVEVITGEESESNVLQMNCKLYAWVCGSWQERGRGILRLNDWDAGQEIHSRLVIRTQGTLTVMLNTKVWAEMSVERASSKSVRFTALDADGQPKIFLAMGSPKDVDLLYNSLEWRVAASRSQTHEEGESDSTKKAKKEETGAAGLTR